MAPAVRCPICHKSVPMDDPNMPFCSDRCRLLDLGNWASEKYVIPVAGGEPEEGVSDEDLQDSDAGQGRWR